MPQQSAEFHRVTYSLPYDRNDPHGSGLLVYHAYGSLIGYDAGYGAGRSITGYGYHVQPHGADAGHGFQLLYCKRPAFGGFYHALIFADRNEGTAEPSYV